jgi:hypothetical protein
MTPTPLILFVWGIAMVLGILPNRILWIALPATEFWSRTRRILGFAALLSSGLWLTLDLALPAILHSRQSAGRLADAFGWCLLLLAVGASSWLIFSRRPTSTTPGRPS